MARRGDRVLIAGGGIGGLATAIALARRGIDTEILERSDFTEQSGAGIQLGPNATRALQRLGVLEAIEPHSFRPEAIAIYDGLSGRRLTSLPLGEAAEARYGAPYLTLHRADLHAGLRAAAQSLAPIALTPGFELAAIDLKAGAVIARAGDGVEAKGASLIGADGLWSTVRAVVSPAARLRFAGGTAWRTRLPRGNLPAPFNDPVVGLWLGPDTHLVHYPVRGGDDLNVVAVTEGGAERQGWDQPAGAEALRAGFTRWAKEFEIVIGTGGRLAQLVALSADVARPLERRPDRTARRRRAPGAALSGARGRARHRGRRHARGLSRGTAPRSIHCLPKL